MQNRICAYAIVAKQCSVSITIMWTLVGLGNPDEEYKGTRHNVGRDMLRAIAEKEGVNAWKIDKKLRATTAKGRMFDTSALVVLPETFMNNSGGAVKPLIASKKGLEQLVVLQDELDLPLGKVKISYGSSAGGHKGAESVQKAVKSKDFVRIRIGISPSTPSGKVRKPDAEKVVSFVIGAFKKSEEETLKKVRKIVGEALELLMTEGKEKAMTVVHSR